MTVDYKQSVNFNEAEELLSWMGEQFLSALGVTDTYKARQILGDLSSVVPTSYLPYTDSHPVPTQLMLQLCTANIDITDKTVNEEEQYGNICFCAPQWQQKKSGYESPVSPISVRSSSPVGGGSSPSGSSQGTGVFFPKAQNPSRAEQQLKMIHSICESVLFEEDEILGMQEVSC